MADFADMIENDYGIDIKRITTKNPQVNSIIERAHQILGNVLYTFQLQQTILDEDDPWSGILTATMFAMSSTVHTTIQSTPIQLVFGRDSMLDISQDTNWK